MNHIIVEYICIPSHFANDHRDGIILGMEIKTKY